MTRSHVLGCLLGLALGDAFGAPYEGGVLERMVWRVVGRSGGKRRWTDDTQMALDVAESVIANAGRVDLDDIAARFAASYRWSRGYGPGAAKLLKRVRRGEDWRVASRAVYPEGSYGNGGAMRAPVLGLLHPGDPVSAARVARDVAAITHAHPLAQDGAALIAAAVAAVGQGRGAALDAAREAVDASSPHRAKLDTVARWLKREAADAPSAREVARELGHGIAAVDSCATALYQGLRFLNGDIDGLLIRVRWVGGDVDTIGAMACALWGAHHGVEALPEGLLVQLEDRARLEAVGTRLCDVIA